MSEQNLSEKSTRQTLGQVEVDIYRRLGADWKKLTDYFQIPPDDEARFNRGDECRAIWAWLQNQRRLDELPAACGISSARTWRIYGYKAGRKAPISITRAASNAGRSPNMP